MREDKAAMSLLLSSDDRARLLPRAAVSLVLLVLFLNPFMEGIEYSNAIPFMFSHYALFAAGMLLSHRITKLSAWYVIPGSAMAVIWHLPYPFAFSGIYLQYRIAEEICMTAAGWLTGSSLHTMSSTMKSVLLAAWFLGDTALSVMFIVSPLTYAAVPVLRSVYSPSQFIILGIAMIFLMNGVIAYLVYHYVRKYSPLLLSDGL